MTTFSELVDQITGEVRRPDLRADIAQYVNQTIRELHVDPESGNVVTYDENFTEEQITATVETGQTWSAPIPGRFQKMGVVQYASVFVDGYNPFARFVKPGPITNKLDHFYYRSGSTFIFGGLCGYGGVGGIINLGYYQYPASCKYYPSETRLAEHDSDTDEWEYADSITTEEQRTAARELSSNWLLQRWHDVIREGARAKTYKRVADTERARTSYSMYETLRKSVYSAEVTGVSGFNE